MSSIVTWQWKREINSLRPEREILCQFIVKNKDPRAEEMV